jgi:glycosyltransferase involved in cell wall biosynthesis
LFVDDDSEDDSVESINIHLKDSQIQYRILKNLRSSNSPKKDAIKTAIHESKFEWILTTDADCILPIQWLSTYDRFIHEQHSEMLAGPVSYASVDYSFVEHFQISEFLSLQGATVGGFGIGKPFLCNGANLAYKKDTFLTLNGFEGNDQIASGDDVFLFEKFVETYPNKVHFLKSTSALVTTLPLKSWTEVIQQKTRWAAKSSSYNLWFTKLVGLIVVLMNLSMIVSLFLFLWDRKNFLTFLIVCLLKVGVDDHLITLTSHFYRGKEKKLRDVGFSSILYPFFSTYVAFRSVFVKYTWKGRKFKK